MARQQREEWAGNEEKLAVLSAWARAGLTDERIAKEIGISRSTLAEWKKKSESIGRALSSGKEIANRRVENSLFDMTQGKIVKLKKSFKVRRTSYDEMGRKVEKEEIEAGEDEIYVEPDIKAIIFWLKNRMPEEWREKVLESQESEGAGENTVILTPKAAKELKGAMNGKNEETDQGKSEKEGAKD